MESRLELIYGGLSTHFSINGVKVSVTPGRSLPTSVDVMVFEEDTNLILTVDEQIRFQEVHPIRLMTEIMNNSSRSPGSLVCNDRNWYAVVLDINADPMCKLQWITDAYINVFERFDKKKIRSAGMHLLGSMHGNIPVEKSVGILLDALGKKAVHYTKNISLVVHEAEFDDTRNEIYKHLRKKETR